MTRAIWKYLLLGPIVDLTMHADATPLYVGTDGGGDLCLWCEVWTDLQEPMISYTAYVVGTGHELPEACMGARYAGSTVRGNGFVWHVYFVRAT